jgi:hypothetical protein
VELPTYQWLLPLEALIHVDPSPSVLAAWRGKRLLGCCAVGFLDFVDASITDVALPQIPHALGFSIQGPQ